MKYVGLALTIPFILNVGMAAALKYQDPLTNENAVEIIQEESINLGIKNTIHLQTTTKKLPHNLAAITLKHPNTEEYILAFNKQYLNKTIIRHEMAHIVAHDKTLHSGGITIDQSIQKLDSLPKMKFFESMYNYLIPEVQANLYALTSIKLF